MPSDNNTQELRALEKQSDRNTKEIKDWIDLTERHANRLVDYKTDRILGRLDALALEDDLKAERRKGWLEALVAVAAVAALGCLFRLDKSRRRGRW